MTDQLSSCLPLERIERSILLIRGHKVILDSDLAALYGVETKTLNRAVKRNLDRFPEDFMFQLTSTEFENLRCQLGTSSEGIAGKVVPNSRSQSVTSSNWGGRRYPPHAFTEQGVAMLSSVLSSPRAIRVNIEIMRAFVRLRRILSSHAELARKLSEMEKKYDAQFRVVFEAIRKLMARPLPPPKQRIGFHATEDD